jgi:hypothetical protein
MVKLFFTGEVAQHLCHPPHSGPHQRARRVGEGLSGTPFEELQHPNGGYSLIVRAYQHVVVDESHQTLP